MRQAKELIGKPIYSLTDGRQVGTVKDVYLDLALSAINGIHLGHEGIFNRKALAIAREHVGQDAALEFSGELVVAMTCDHCQEVTPVFKRMARLYEGETTCPTCNNPRDLVLTHRITGAEEFLDRTLAEVDVPPLDIIRARGKEAQAYLELTGDKETFLRFT